MLLTCRMATQSKSCGTSQSQHHNQSECCYESHSTTRYSTTSINRHSPINQMRILLCHVSDNRNHHVHYILSRSNCPLYPSEHEFEFEIVSRALSSLLLASRAFCFGLAVPRGSPPLPCTTNHHLVFVPAFLDSFDRGGNYLTRGQGCHNVEEVPTRTISTR